MALAGTPGEVVQQVRRVMAVPEVRRVIVLPQVPGLAVAARAEILKLFADEVMARV
jgi:alkanesulfonate monooxygenase SsuD/methylene tetrahydromethanopterin reductase-like flavin-dependent oxidoreductase (luciferase family)